MPPLVSASKLMGSGVSTDDDPIIAVDDQDKLPATADAWPHRPVWLKAGHGTKILGLSESNEQQQAALPLGVPIEFETDLFRGKLLVRLRNVKSDHPEQHDAYFDGRKRLVQTVVQGRFRKPVPMSDVYVGTIFRQPLRHKPPSLFLRLMNAVMKRVAPGILIDLHSDQPRVVALLAGSSQSVSINTPGQEPDITSKDLPENLSPTFGADYFQSISHRKKILSTPSKASQYEFDTAHVYTFHAYDEKMDYGTYSIELPMYGNYNFSAALGPQPMTISAVTTCCKGNHATGGGDVLYSFDLWHESVYQHPHHPLVEDVEEEEEEAASCTAIEVEA